MRSMEAHHRKSEFWRRVTTNNVQAMPKGNTSNRVFYAMCNANNGAVESREDSRQTDWLVLIHLHANFSRYVGTPDLLDP